MIAIGQFVFYIPFFIMISILFYLLFVKLSETKLSIYVTQKNF
ncbi:hypothetical protein OIS_02892 [Enterococcus faecium EnGen0035]|nr:hypothetical protein OIS_02892 [Enterococcus faecium EnGen0035]EOF54755.1 hypothetical protein SCW_01143 [Enterococcus faecium EnGen0131]EOF79683.1 hypothetical protein SGC_01367 [Enterococcus faecium EnGen0136]EOF89994.1 hypothetical protein SK5_00889 [Enterococcus faecium EnGen0161]EOF91160.1 hypothetical protein SK7_00751 [Enterococcus faecium EnGen0162]EOG29448.1 hypothetical protein SMO_00912 [Enterococcus faecium EnGen0182]EOI51180.1 hypothetical protein UIY_00748 [Enterococcus faeci